MSFVTLSPIKARQGCKHSDPETGPIRRKYKRHPKVVCLPRSYSGEVDHEQPDRNAPERPLTAYLRFSIDWRKDHDLTGLSFADMAKHIGRDWQTLCSQRKSAYLDEALSKWIEYRVALDHYSVTKEFRDYAQYLRAYIRDHPDTNIGSVHAKSYLSLDPHLPPIAPSGQHSPSSIDEPDLTSERCASSSSPSDCVSAEVQATGETTDSLMTPSTMESLTDASTASQPESLPRISPLLLDQQQDCFYWAQSSLQHSLMAGWFMPLKPINASSRFYRPMAMTTDTLAIHQQESASQGAVCIDPTLLSHQGLGFDLLAASVSGPCSTSHVQNRAVSLFVTSTQLPGNSL